MLTCHCTKPKKAKNIVFASAVSVVFRKMALGCDHQKVKIHRYRSYSNNCRYFPREIMIIGRRIQKIVTCFNFLAPTTTSKFLLWQSPVLSVRWCSGSSRGLITRLIAVPHRCVVRHPVPNRFDISCIKLLTTGAVSH